MAKAPSMSSQSSPQLRATPVPRLVLLSRNNAVKWLETCRTYLTKWEAREKVVLDREEIGTQGNQRMSLSHFLQLERIEIPLVHLMNSCWPRTERMALKKNYVTKCKANSSASALEWPSVGVDSSA